MGTTILIISVAFGVIFILAYVIASSVKKKAGEADNTDTEKQRKSIFPWRNVSTKAVFVCEYKDGSIILPEGSSLVFIRKDVSKIFPLSVYVPKVAADIPSDEDVPMVEISVGRLRDEEEELDWKQDCIVEPLYWVTPDFMVGRVPDGERRVVVKCSKEDFEKKSVKSHVSKTLDSGFEIEEMSYIANVVNVREEPVRVQEVYLKK